METFIYKLNDEENINDIIDWCTQSKFVFLVANATFDQMNKYNLENTAVSYTTDFSSHNHTFNWTQTQTPALTISPAGSATFSGGIQFYGNSFETYGFYAISFKNTEDLVAFKLRWA